MPDPLLSDRLADPDRLAAIVATRLADAPATEPMQRISRLVSRMLSVPVSLSTLIDTERQFFAAATGFDVEPWATARQTPLSHSVCQHVVGTGGPLMIADTRSDPRLAGNRAGHDLGVVAYLGVPLRAPGGEVLGALCAIDDQPREWSLDEQDALTDLSELATDDLRHRLARAEIEVLIERLVEENRTDELTGVRNRREWRDRVPVELARARREARPVSMVMLDLDGFKAVNDRRGHVAGDKILTGLAARWSQIIREPDLLVRWGGDEFAVLLVDAGVRGARDVASRLIAAAEPLIPVSAGVAEWNGSEVPAELLARADAQLMAAKRRR